jgi:outer membrane lipoprotein carrier protein
MRVFRSAFLVLLLTILFPGAAVSAGINGVVEKLQKKYESISSIEATFTQDVFTSSLNRSEVNEGRVLFKKPGKWKWLYNDPAKGVFTSNGSKVWLFEPDLNQVIEKDVDASSAGITTDFLTGVGNLSRDFDIRLSEDRPGSWLLELTPRTELPNVKKLFLEVDKAELLVVKTVVSDHLGNRASITFKDIKTNPLIKDSVFEFKPPKGSIVVRP